MKAKTIEEKRRERRVHMIRHQMENIRLRIEADLIAGLSVVAKKARLAKLEKEFSDLGATK